MAAQPLMISFLVLLVVVAVVGVILWRLLRSNRPPRGFEVLPTTLPPIDPTRPEPP